MHTRDVQVDSQEHLLECGGLTVRDFFLPPFLVKTGQSVCLHVRLLSPKWQEELVPILSGRVAHPAMHLHGSVTYVERPLPRRRWWGKRYNPSAGDWLTTEKGLTASEAAAILHLVGEPAELSVGAIGWNERTMLDLEASLLHPPSLLIFDTAGNDPLGIQRIFERLSFRPPNLALLYLKTGHETDALCLPGATCLEMARAPVPATIAE